MPRIKKWGATGAPIRRKRAEKAFSALFCQERHRALRLKQNKYLIKAWLILAHSLIVENTHSRLNIDLSISFKGSEFKRKSSNTRRKPGRLIDGLSSFSKCNGEERFFHAMRRLEIFL